MNGCESSPHCKDHPCDIERLKCGEGQIVLHGNIMKLCQLSVHIFIQGAAFELDGCKVTYEGKGYSVTWNTTICPLQLGLDKSYYPNTQRFES